MKTEAIIKAVIRRLINLTKTVLFYRIHVSHEATVKKLCLNQAFKG